MSYTPSPEWATGMKTKCTNCDFVCEKTWAEIGNSQPLHACPICAVGSLVCSGYLGEPPKEKSDPPLEGDLISEPKIIYIVANAATSIYDLFSYPDKETAEWKLDRITTAIYKKWFDSSFPSAADLPLLDVIVESAKQEANEWMIMEVKVRKINNQWVQV